MKKLFTYLLMIVFLCSVWIYANSGVVRADELTDIEKQLHDLQNNYEMSVAATKPLESQVSMLEQKLLGIQNSIKKAELDLDVLQKSIFKREVDLSFQIKLLEERVRSSYINKHRYNPLLVLMVSNVSMGDMVRGLVYRKAATNQDKQIILTVAEQLNQLEDDKKKLVRDSKRLETLKTDANKQAVFLRGEIKKAKSYQRDLTSQIAVLSARQQQLLAEKTGNFTTSVGDVPLADDPASRPDYDPGFSPAFALFSFGAPHFKGMSQYGARGRARRGQSVDQIIHAYYGDVRVETRNDLPASINTSVGALPLESNYLMGIAEMPSSWTDNNSAALKAQAIVARSYALAYVGWRLNGGGGGGSICTGESCQVYLSSKAAAPPAEWRSAVEATKGQIVVSNSTGEIVNTFYAASSGGFQKSYTSLGHTTPNLWDTVCGNQGCWTSEAFERVGESPWFYKAWYKSRSGKTCGRTHPWLTQDEFADIVNSLLVYTNDPESGGHFYPVDGCLVSDSDTWSVDKVREEAAKYGGPVSSISHVEVNYSNAGVTNRVYITTDKGVKDFSGDDFKLIFNLRAPGVVHLKSGLFNIEQK